MNDPLSGRLDYAERIYIRMEAEHVLQLCLNQGEITHFTHLVEELVLAGQPAYGVMREILDEIQSVRAGMNERGIEIRQDLNDALSELGIDRLDQIELDSGNLVRLLCNNKLDLHLEKQNPGLDPDTSEILTEVCVEASDQLRDLAAQLSLLTILEAYLRDWYQGIAYQILHQQVPPSNSLQKKHLH